MSGFPSPCPESRREHHYQSTWGMTSLLSLQSPIVAQGGGLVRSSLSYQGAPWLIHCSSPGLPLKPDLFPVLILVFLSPALETQFLPDLQNGHYYATVCFPNQPNQLPVLGLPRMRVHRFFFELKISVSLPPRSYRHNKAPNSRALTKVLEFQTS